MRLLSLLLLGTALHAADPRAGQPLIDAIRHGDVSSMKRALDGGIKPDARDADGVPALMTAALFAGADAVQLLLERGADANAANSTGATALMWAIPNVEKVRLLLAHG